MSVRATLINLELWGSRAHLLHEVRKGQWVERKTREVRDVMVGDCSRVQALYSVPREERPARYWWTTSSNNM